MSGTNDPGKPDLSCLHDGVERELLGHRAFTTASLRTLTHYYLFPSGVALATPPTPASVGPQWCSAPSYLACEVRSELEGMIVRT